MATEDSPERLLDKSSLDFSANLWQNGDMGNGPYFSIE